MTAGSAAFIDTNALIYADQARSSCHLTARAALARLEQEDSALWISRQVLREYLSNVTRPQPNGSSAMTAEAAVDAVEGFRTVYRIAEDGPHVTTELLKLLRTVPVGGKQVHDANIAATMQAYSLRRLLTFNAADFRRFAGVIELITP